MPDILEFVRNGQVKLVFVPINRVGGPGADETARAAVCAGEQGKFWEMHDVMFHWQGRVNPSKPRIDTAAEELGLDTGDFDNCYDSGETRDTLRQAWGEMTGLGFNATPTVFLDGAYEPNPGAIPGKLRDRFETGG
jgi:protein-disulfide isomerase